jgi:hypothetical protein
MARGPDEKQHAIEHGSAMPRGKLQPIDGAARALRLVDHEGKGTCRDASSGPQAA